MVINTYFDKDNTLVYNNSVNTAKNPVAELWYGGGFVSNGFTRHIFHFDEEKLRNLYSGGTIPILNKTTHTLRMTNASTFDLGLLGKTTYDFKRRATSFDLILFKVPQYWDEGVGYDYRNETYISYDEPFMSYAPSNYLSATTLNPWQYPGIYSGSSSGVTIATQHFDNGNENLEMDITDVVNQIITGDTNYGFGIAFDSQYESLQETELQYVGFFTENTQTAFEPHIQTIYNNPIIDDRDNFYTNKDNCLYLYVNVGGKPKNLDNLPSVDIFDENDDLYLNISEAEHVTKGVYKACFSVSGDTECVTYRDVWKNISLNGKTRPDVEMEFNLKSDDSHFDLGSDNSSGDNYSVSIIGINRDERINKGTFRKVIVNLREDYTVNKQKLVDDLEYRIYIKEGKDEYTIVDFQPVNRSTENYFMLHTESLLPNTYYIDIRSRVNDEINIIKEVVNFDIVSQVEQRDK